MLFTSTDVSTIFAIKTKVDCNDAYSQLRRVLPRNQEFTEKGSQINTALSYICIFDHVIPTLLRYLDHLIKEFKKYDENSKAYFKHYTRIQDTVDAIQDLCIEYDKFLNRIIGGILVHGILIFRIQEILWT